MKSVILAGGLGTRLRPFTEIIPKPLLPLGEKALLEVQVEHLKKFGFNEIFVATNYKSDFIKAYLGDGERYGVNITYSEEKERLGTCGPLSLLRNVLDEPFLVVNGDVLSKADFGRIYDRAVIHDDSDITIVTKNILTPFRFGKIVSDGDYVIDIEEKPDIEFEILAGIYVLKPAVFKYIPSNTYFGMDDLLKKMLSHGDRITKYLMEEYWIDIGQIGDYNEAVDIYKKHFE